MSEPTPAERLHWFDRVFGMTALGFIGVFTGLVLGTIPGSRQLVKDYLLARLYSEPVPDATASMALSLWIGVGVCTALGVWVGWDITKPRKSRCAK